MAKIFFVCKLGGEDEGGLSHTTLDSARAELHALAKLGCHEIAPRLEGVVVPEDDRKRVLKALAQQQEIHIGNELNDGRYCMQDVSFCCTAKLHIASSECVSLSGITCTLLSYTSPLSSLCNLRTSFIGKGSW